MDMFCQLDYAHVPYGDGTVAGNGCACCVMAAVAGMTPDAVAAAWGDRYWDDDEGTLPRAFDDAGSVLGIELVRVRGSAEPRNGNLLVLLPDAGGGLHYEMIEVTASGGVLHDPRRHEATNLQKGDVASRVSDARAVWRR